ncbi:NAD(P)/FAD-dependent oxidoreductase [Microbacterium capsulatum]|uniref:NAD(P)/FAD-dependent oxidoreductase n=1 Tax=Microbacterium capsulatum TaxID=3041921 RepID=A0ABU0XDC3_9MICO|nr:NAD(P)/FAD-dependent oxidoreductase [Microbacterium sp. ASV81]MDQ4213115.1 NAD(P)/FAD-dependent oxidoreductase [Microbacterium sp. ASV81]
MTAIQPAPGAVEQTPAGPGVETLERDVVVIGAGISGLVAARRLVQARHSVAVLEARDRVGGRTWSQTIDGSFFEIGGQWISAEQSALKALLAELGKETFSRYREGNSVYVTPDGERHEFVGDFPVAPATLAEIGRLVDELDELAAQMDVDAPWEHPDAAELDRIAFDGWLAAHSDDDQARRIVEHYIAAGMLTKPAHAFSVLQALLMIASAENFENLIDEGLLLDERVVGGMQSVSEQIAAELGAHVVRLNAPVRSLHRSATDDGAPGEVLAVSDTVQVRARYAVVAVPPNLYARIDHVPELPREKQVAHQHVSMGLVIKAQAAYERPFWRDHGLSGTGFASHELVCEVYDNSSPHESRGTIVGFIAGEAADRAWALEEEDRRAAVLDSFAAYFGAEATEPVAFYLSDWGSEQWTRGAYGASYDLGGLSRWGHQQNQPTGPVFFASSDIQGAGYMHVDGGVRIGTDTAARIADGLAGEG